MCSKNYINEDNYIDDQNESHKVYKHPKKPKYHKKTGNKCYCLNMLEQSGPIYIINHPKCSYFFVSKMELVKFNDHFDDLFEKGKIFKKEQLEDLNKPSSPDNTFWYQRYYYYSKYDEGILMDHESWWSVTPEIIAEYTAKLAKNCSVIDGFCGSGGNVIQFSKYCSEVFAIDIDPKKLEICKNNCRIYNCKNNIHFIEYDFLKIQNYDKIKVKADYIFLSPPWGGISYKNSDIYSIKESMTPDISEIIKVSLKIVKYIMFYVPRTLMLNELFQIISEINKNERLFFDIHILKSANKIKALLIIFGYDINKKIKENDIEEYLKYIYENFNLSDIYIKMISAIAKTIGNYRFFENEIDFRNNMSENIKNKTEKIDENFNVGKELFNYFFNTILTNAEKIKLKSLKIYSQFKAMNNSCKINNKNNINKINNKNEINNINNITEKNNGEINHINIINIADNPSKFLDKYTVEYTGDNNDVYIAMKEEKIEEKMIIQKNKNLKLSPKVKKKINLKEFFDTDKEKKEKNNFSNSPTNTISTATSPILTSNNSANPIISGKNEKSNGDWVLTSCHEINLSFINKK
jgi:16S rRNA G966 N2-methylase RsmD